MVEEETRHLLEKMSGFHELMPIEVAESMVTMDTLSNAHQWAGVMRAMQNADDDDKRVSLLLSSVGTAQMRLLGLAKHWYECDCSH